jgi:hypothetical protein
MFDAVVCAYTGYLRSRDSWQIQRAFGDALDPQGWIWIPPEAAAEASPQSPLYDRTTNLNRAIKADG